MRGTRSDIDSGSGLALLRRDVYHPGDAELILLGSDLAPHELTGICRILDDAEILVGDGGNLAAENGLTRRQRLASGSVSDVGQA